MIRVIRTAIGFLILGAAVSGAVEDQQYVISTFAGGAPPPTPVLGVDMPLAGVQSVAADGLGNTYFVAFHSVFKLDQNGVATRIGGNGRAGYSGDGRPATSAQLRLVSVDYGAGNLAAAGAVVGPPGLAVDAAGNVYVADNGNYRIRRISPDGIITTVAGNGTPGFSGDDGPAIAAQVSSVSGLAVSVAGKLLIADYAANRIRQVTPDGSIATVAGTGGCGFSGDGGPAGAAQLCGPAGISVDAEGNLFITDLGNNRIRMVSPDGTITTVVGTGPTGFTADAWDCWPAGDGGPALSAALCRPSSIAVDSVGNLFVADTYFTAMNWWQVVRKISRSGITTVGGFDCLKLGTIGNTWTPAVCSSLGDGTTATKTFLAGPLGVAVDNAGNLLVADAFGPNAYPSPGRPHIFKVSSDGAIDTVAGNDQQPFWGDGGLSTSAPRQNVAPGIHVHAEPAVGVPRQYLTVTTWS